MNNQQPNRNSGMGIGLVMTVLGLILFIGPNLIPKNSPFQLAASSQLVLMGFGVIVLILGVVLTVISKLYVKTTADMAFVRTGGGGAKVVMDGGAIVVPFYHSIMWVSLSSIKLNLERSGKGSLRTSDYLRADIKAEIYLRVRKTDESIKIAASRLGSKASDSERIKEFVEQKCDAALRAVTAQLKLEELNSNREKMQSEAKTTASHDIELNGLEVESFVITSLEQTPSGELQSEQNIFDAVGAKTIADMTSQARVARSTIEQETARKVKEIEVTTQQQLLTLDLARESAEAENAANIRKAKSETEQAAIQFEIRQRQQSELAQVEAEKAVRLAQVQRETELAVKEQERDQQEQEAGIKKQQAVEVASQEKQGAIATAEQSKVVKETERVNAQKDFEVSMQALKTVEAKAAAERNAGTSVIAKEAEAKIRLINAEAEAAAEATRTIRLAEAEATAAEKQAMARIRLAEAEKESQVLAASGAKEAQVLKAEGDRAISMVPVEVEGRRVEVQRAQVEVDIQKMKAQTENSEVAVRFELDKIQIEAQRDAEIARAKSFGEGLSKADMTIYGDPITLAKMYESFSNGQAMGNTVAGLLDGTPREVTDFAMQGLTNLGVMGAAIVERLTGIKVTAEEVEKAASEMVRKQNGKDKD